MLSEHRWALVGRIITYGGGLIALVLALFQLGERFVGPELVGVYQTVAAALDPLLEDELSKRIEIRDLKKVITAGQQKGEPSEKIIESLEKLFDDTEEQARRDLLNELALWNRRPLVLMRMQNDGTEVATNVRVMFAGSGVARLSETGVRVRDAETVKWSREIALGNIRPGGEMHLQVWPEDLAIGLLESARPALVSNEGTGKLHEAVAFYGWGAKLMINFILASATKKLGFILILLFVLAIPIWLLTRMGYVRFGRLDK